MPDSPREIGTLIVVVLKARNLPNKRHIGKQDPYCTIDFNGQSRRTKAIKRGGQHPEWDEEIRFTLYEADSNATSDPDSPPPPPKKYTDREVPTVEGGTQMTLACHAEYLRDPEFIGETKVDLGEVLTKGETDEWFVLHNKGKYSGEVYLELTFWSNEPPPAKKSSTKPKAKNQYGGPGSFVPSDAPSPPPSTPPGGSGTPPRDPYGASPSRAYGISSESLPSSLKASSSILQSALYVAPYETTRSQRSYQSVDNLANDFAELGVQNDPNRSTLYQSPPNSYTYPPPSNIQHPQSSSATYSDNHQAYQDYDYDTSGSYQDDAGTYEYDHAHGDTSASSQPAPYQAPYESSGSTQSTRTVARHRSHRHSIPTSSSGFVALNPPAPSGFVPITQQSTGYLVSHSPSPLPSGYERQPSPQRLAVATTPAPAPQPYGHSPVHAPLPPPSVSLPATQNYSSTFTIAAAPYTHTGAYYQQYAPPPGPPPAPVHSSVPPPSPQPPSHYPTNGAHASSLPPGPPQPPSQAYHGQQDYGGSNYGQMPTSYPPHTQAPPSLSHSTSTPLHIHSRPLPEPGVTRSRRHSIVSSNPSQLGYTVRPPSQIGYPAYSQVLPPPTYSQQISIPPPPPLRHSSSLDSNGVQVAYAQAGAPAGTPLPYVPPPPPLQHITPPPSQHPRTPSRQPSLQTFVPAAFPQQPYQPAHTQVPPPPALAQGQLQGYRQHTVPHAINGANSIHPGPLPRPPQYVLPPPEPAQQYPISGSSWQ